MALQQKRNSGFGQIGLVATIVFVATIAAVTYFLTPSSLEGDQALQIAEVVEPDQVLSAAWATPTQAEAVAVEQASVTTSRRAEGIPPSRRSISGVSLGRGAAAQVVASNAVKADVVGRFVSCPA